MSIATQTAPNYELIQQDGLETSLLEVSMGPHHPSTHGVFRMDVKLDGETVVDLKPVFGYLHRNHEKLAENMSYLASMPFTDRLDYFNSMTNNWAYALAAEQLIEIEVPERAEYLRVIMAELTRLVNHVSLVGFFVNDLGALGTPLLYAFREREKILDLFEQASGARMMCNYFRFGGLRCDVPDGWLDRTRELVDRFPEFLDEYEKLLCESPAAQFFILLRYFNFLGIKIKHACFELYLSEKWLRLREMRVISRIKVSPLSHAVSSLTDSENYVTMVSSSIRY